MANPILMQMQRNNSVMPIMDMLRRKNPADILNGMMMQNPQFRQFYEENKDKPISEVCRKYGVDENALSCMMKQL